ncbi:MAG: DNA polymerase I, partial [Deltaproteobacteria bacterium HGW-Deltaproteobacteria-7]
MTEEKKTPLLALVDGSNYLYRAYYGIPALTNSKGFPTNAIYGFTTMLLKLMRDLEPDYVVVAFDLKGPTTRHGEFEDYKATRKPMPDDLIPQVPFIKDIIRGFSICIMEQQGIEADDLIGTLTLQATKKGWRTAVISGDKDLMQLIGDHVTMVDTMKDKTYDAAAVKEKFGVGPDKVVEILGLMGDTSDNIPGVPGIGPKTAKRLIEEYGSVDVVIENAERLHNVKLRDSFRRYADQARLSRQLALIRTDIDLNIHLEDTARREPDKDTLTRLFSEFEFSSLLQQIKTNAVKPVKACNVVADSTALAALAGKLQGSAEIACEIIWEKNPPQELIGLSVNTGGELFYLPIGHTNAKQQLAAREVFAALAPVFANAAIKKYVYDLKTTLVAMPDLDIHSGVDLQLAAYLLDPARHSYELNEVAWEYLHERIAAPNDVAGGKGKTYPLALVPMDRMAAYAGERAEALLNMALPVKDRLEETGAASLYNDVEMPLLFTLAAMEKKGVLVDAALLKQMSEDLGQLLALSEEKIH